MINQQYVYVSHADRFVLFQGYAIPFGNGYVDSSTQQRTLQACAKALGDVFAKRQK